MDGKYYCIRCIANGDIEKMLNHAKTSHHVFTNKKKASFNRNECD